MLSVVGLIYWHVRVALGCPSAICFTRELVEQRNVILPVWHNVLVEDVYNYSPMLADRVAVRWTDQEEVAGKLLIAIGP